MTRARSALALSGLLLALTQASRAQACGAEVLHYYDVDTYTQGTDVPLNAPILISLKPVGDGAADGGLFEPRLTLTKAGTNQKIAAKSVGVRTALAFVAPELLEPHTTYELSLDNLPAANETTLPSRTWELTTGAAAAPALSLSGKLQVTLEPGTDPVMDCSNANDCGGGCVMSGTTAVTKARVKLPQVAGGFAKRIGLLHLTDNSAHVFGAQFDATPHDVNTGQIIDLEDPSMTEVWLTVPLEDKPYEPCFAYAVDDARTDEVVAESLCLELFPTQGGAVDGSAGSSSTPPNTDASATNDEKHTSSGCSFGRAPSGAVPWTALLGLLALSRRRRSKNAL